MAEMFHVLSRGVDKRKIFMDDKDYLRFVHDLFEFNDEEKANNSNYHFSKKNMAVVKPYIENLTTSTSAVRHPRKLLVKLHAFCLMPNHYHLLITPMKEKGLTKFMKKLNGGYAQYFNNKYERRGTLFEGRYKSVIVKEDSHFIHLPYYIHLNPLDIRFPAWRNRELTNYKKAIKFLESYRWSSHLDYIGVKNFPSVTQRDRLLEFFEGVDGYKKSIKQWLKAIDLNTIQHIALEH